mgnify:CR=1 FL=1|jgi:flagellar protein FlaF
MGMSVSIATAIIFIASLISFASIIGALDHAQGSVLEAQKASSQREADAMRTSVALSFVDGPNGTFGVVNSGEVTLTTQVDVLINGALSNEKISSMSVEGKNDTKLWLPGEMLIITMSEGVNGAAIKIVTANGVSVYG